MTFGEYLRRNHSVLWILSLKAAKRGVISLHQADLIPEGHHCHGHIEVSGNIFNSQKVSPFGNGLGNMGKSIVFPRKSGRR